MDRTGEFRTLTEAVCVTERHVTEARAQLAAARAQLDAAERRHIDAETACRKAHNEMMAYLRERGRGQ